MNRHQPHALRSFLQNGRLRCFRALRLRFELVDESAERDAAGEFEGPGQIRDPVNVGEDLMASRTQREAGVRARGLQQQVDGFGNGAAVASAVESAKKQQRFGDRRQIVVGFAGQRTEGMQRTNLETPAKQRRVGDREQSAAERGEDRQFVVGPFHRRQRGAERFHLLAMVKRFRADQQMLNVARFQTARVAARDVVAVIDHAAEQQADMARGDRNEAIRRFGVAHPPSAFANQPFDVGADSVGQTVVDGYSGDPLFPVRFRRGKYDQGGLIGNRGGMLSRGT